MRILALATFITAVLAVPRPAPATPTASDGKGPIDLTMDNFKQSVESGGLWWIKFFSPYCHHCAAFAPTWIKLYEEYKDNKDLHFGSVNCVSQGDLCNQENIMAYPAINLYKGGKVTDTQKMAEQDVFELYIEKQLKAFQESPSKSVAGKFPKFPTSTEEVNQKYPGLEKPETAVPSDAVNPEGKSEQLDRKDFTQRVTATRDSWFIQFYSPSSPSSREIQTAWKQMAIKAQGRLNIGQVNCDVEKELCKEAGVTDTPMLKYFASTMSSEYKGLRGLGDLLQFLERAVGARTPKAITLSDYNKMAKSQANNDEVTFVYLYDKATSSEDFQALEKLAVAIVGRVNIVKSSDPKLIKVLEADQLPALFAVSADKVVAYESLAPHEIRDHGRLVTWAKQNWLPLVPQMTPINSADLFANKLVVLAILDPREEADMEAALKELRAVARELQTISAKEEVIEIEELRKKKQLKIEEAKDRGDKTAEEQAGLIRVEITNKQRIAIAWIDGVFWERWVKTRYGSNEGYKSRVVIHEESTGRYWDRNWGHGILLPSRSQILETIQEIASPAPRVQYRTLRGAFGSSLVHARNYVLEHQTLSVLVVIAVCVGVYLKRRGMRSSGGSSEGGLLDKLD